MTWDLQTERRLVWEIWIFRLRAQWDSTVDSWRGRLRKVEERGTTGPWRFCINLRGVQIDHKISWPCFHSFSSAWLSTVLEYLDLNSQDLNALWGFLKPKDQNTDLTGYDVTGPYLACCARPGNAIARTYPILRPKMFEDWGWKRAMTQPPLR